MWCVWCRVLGVVCSVWELECWVYGVGAGLGLSMLSPYRRKVELRTGLPGVRVNLHERSRLRVEGVGC